MRIILLIILLLLVAAVVWFLIGSKVTRNEDSYLYDLPYARGSQFKVVQGYGGLFSHKHKAALDFAMPVGTPVHAAREGTIYSYRDDSDKGGLSPKYKSASNYIMIKHADGSFGCYWHLKKNGVVVKKGKVAKGQLIGYSGKTGFVLRPHLHFAVKRKLNYEMDSFVKTKFRTAKGNKFLKSGYKYKNPGGQN